MFNSISLKDNFKNVDLIPFLKQLIDSVYTYFEEGMATTSSMYNLYGGNDSSYISNFFGNGDTSVNTLDNIFPMLYQMFTILLSPLGTLNNESDFIYCIFAMASPLNIYFTDFNFIISKQYQYYLSYSNTNNLFRIPMCLFLIIRTLYRKFISIPPIENVSDFILPDNIKSLVDLNDIIHILPEDVILSGYCMYYVMLNIGINASLNVDVPILLPSTTADMIFKLVTNIIIKLAYTNACVIICLNASISPFHYISSFDSFKMTAFESNISISNVCLNCVDVYPYKSIFEEPKIISCNLNFNNLHPILMSFDTNTYWTEIFSVLKVKYTATSVVFLATYVVVIEIKDLKVLCSIFFIRDDMVCVFNRSTYLLLSDTLYARPSKFAFTNMLPGEQVILLSKAWSNTLSRFYGLSATFYSILVSQGASQFGKSSIIYAFKAAERINIHKEKTCDNIISYCLSDIDKILYIYLIHKHIMDGKFFEYLPPIKGPNDIHFDLITYLLAINTYKQAQIKIASLSFTWEPSNPDIPYILSKIENMCVESFNSLVNKNMLNPLCRCLYRPGSDLSPICFDTRCMTSLQDENSIFIKYPCKYPTCSQTLDISNFMSNSLDINNINYQASCGAFDNKDSLSPGDYYIYFKGGFYWSTDPANNIILGPVKNPFTLIYDNSGVLNIKNVNVISNKLVFREASELPIIIGLLENEIFIMHKLNSSIIYGNGKFVFCDYVRSSSVNTIIYFVKV